MNRENDLEKKLMTTLGENPKKLWSLEELFSAMGLSIQDIELRRIVFQLLREKKVELTKDSKLKAR